MVNIVELRITKVEAIPLRLPVKYILKLATGEYPFLEPVLVKIHTNLGVIGIGEVECYPGYDRIGPEPPKGVVQLLEEILTPLLIGENPFDIELIYQKMNTAIQGHVWVKAGVDIALWDLMGRALNVPTYYLLGGAVRRESQVEGVGYGIPMVEPEEVAKIAKDAVDRGFSELELKVGDRYPTKDVERLRMAREAVGSKPSIKLDFNKGYNATTAILIIREMEQYGPQWVEQPVDYWDLEGMVRIRNSIKTPLVADECVNTAHEMMIVAKMGAADAIHIKPAVKGGLTEAKRIEFVASAAGMFIIPGTMVPTGVGMGAVHSFLASCRQVHRGIHGSPMDLLADDIVKDPIPPGSPTIHISNKPGLGFELDEEKVAKYRTA
jgi:L-alanine-DL-glutamate epimerase-like enolase superfamily enzyme